MEDKIFSVTESGFEELALDIFHFQYRTNTVYQAWVNTVGIDASSVMRVNQVPFLPINFFKTHQVVSTGFEAEAIFESSGTTGMVSSRHFVRDLQLYRSAFLNGFGSFYGPPDQYCIIGLLPSYIERQNSSLVMMVNELIKESRHAASGFYLDEHEALRQVLLENEKNSQPTIMIGVTFALLDFAEKFEMQLKNTIVMETGGMKGRRAELLREEVHEILKTRLGVDQVHSEYGMTELLSQAYSLRDGIFQPQRWMKVLARDAEDPMHILSLAGKESVKGALNIIDLANIFSCSFIATDDLGTVFLNGEFSVDGRFDHTDLRGCSLLTV